MRPFPRARHIIKARFHITRVAVNPMEGRTALGVYDTRDERYTLHAGLQSPHVMRLELAKQYLQGPGEPAPSHSRPMSAAPSA